jgi:hypothetical protein
MPVALGLNPKHIINPPVACSRKIDLDGEIDRPVRIVGQVQGFLVETRHQIRVRGFVGLHGSLRHHRPA